MDRPTCETCVYWQLHYDCEGSCRKHAPQGPYRHQDMRFCPTVEDEWCGEHQDFHVYVEWRRQEKTKGGGT